MLRTITVGTISVQGMFEGNTADGKMVVRVDNRLYKGRPVDRKS
ncbi:hypothetical protein [Thioclava sp. SK-1]|nr:hypothetical protein [Thioclava sp. SK-1]